MAKASGPQELGRPGTIYITWLPSNPSPRAVYPNSGQGVFCLFNHPIRREAAVASSLNFSVPQSPKITLRRWRSIFPHLRGESYPGPPLTQAHVKDLWPVSGRSQNKPPISTNRGTEPRILSATLPPVQFRGLPPKALYRQKELGSQSIDTLSHENRSKTPLCSL